MENRFYVGRIRNSSLTRSRFGDYDFKEEIIEQLGIELPEKGHGTYGKLLFDKRWYSRRAEILARESSAHEIDGFKFPSVKSGDVGIAWHLGPVPSENLLTVRLNLDLPSANHAGAF